SGTVLSSYRGPAGSCSAGRGSAARLPAGNPVQRRTVAGGKPPRMQSAKRPTVCCRPAVGKLVGCRSAGCELERRQSGRGQSEQGADAGSASYREPAAGNQLMGGYAGGGQNTPGSPRRFH